MDAEQELLRLVNSQAKIETIKVNGFSVRYLVAGSGPAVVLLHGINMGWGTWYPNIRELAKHFTVYALDLPGAGGSSIVDFRSADFEKSFVDTVEDFMRIMDLRKVYLVGHSLGAWVALRLTFRERTAIQKIVLVSPVGINERTPWRYKILGMPFMAQILAKTVMKPNKKNMSSFLRGVFYYPEKLDERLINYYVASLDKQLIKNHPLLLLHRIAGFFRVHDEFMLLEEIIKIKKPLLFIFGKHDPIVRVNRELLSLLKKIPNAKIEIFSETGHVPSTEKSSEFNLSVIHFLMA